MFNLNVSPPLTLFVSLAALAGVALHETKIDKLATTFAGIPAMVISTENGQRGLSNDSHPHVEKVGLSEVRSAQPALAPRLGDQKKHMLQKGVPKGAHHFDGYVVPLV
jgi:hypothetical protein